MAAPAQIQLPAGYEDAQPVRARGIHLPAGYEDAQPVRAQPVRAQDTAYSEYGAQASGDQVPSGYDPATFAQRHPLLSAAGTGVNAAADETTSAISGLGNAIAHPVDTVKNIIKSKSDQFSESFKENARVTNDYNNAKSQGMSDVDSLMHAQALADARNAHKDAVIQYANEVKKKGVTEATVHQGLNVLRNAAAAYAGGELLGAAAPELGELPAEAFAGEESGLGEGIGSGAPEPAPAPVTQAPSKPPGIMDSVLHPIDTAKRIYAGKDVAQPEAQAALRGSW